VITHLNDLKTDIKYFPNIDEKQETWNFIRNRFQCEVVDIFNEGQEEFLELKFCFIANDDLKELDHARILTMFGSTFLCYAALSALLTNDHVHGTGWRSKETYIVHSLEIKPRIKDLLANKQCQVLEYCLYIFLFLGSEGGPWHSSPPPYACEYLTNA